MPELPEVETIVQGLQKKIINHQVVKVIIKFPGIIKGDKVDFSKSLIGASVLGVSRRGKHIIIKFSNQKSLVIHLKMTGQLLYINSKSPLLKHTHLIFDFADSLYQLRYRDVRKFGYMILTESCVVDSLPQIKKLGLDPLEASLSDFTRLIKSKKRQIKSLLLDQTVIAGLGNIYTDEILYQSRIHPKQLAYNLSNQKINKLYSAMQDILIKAIEHSGSSVENYVNTDGEQGSYQNFHQVYRRQEFSCNRCGHQIIRIKSGGRGTYLCPHCQKLKNF